MTWSYSGDPSDSDLDAVRFEIGDTDTDDQQFSNEEIQHVLDEQGGIHSASVACCEILARKYAREADFQLGPLRVYASQRAEMYKQLALELRNRVSMNRLPYVGGLSENERTTDEADTDLVQPAFKRDMMAYYDRDVEEDW